ncbi:MAG: hypothetical protein ACTSWE_05780 [Promethearchaeota archaeon]
MSLMKGSTFQFNKKYNFRSTSFSFIEREALVLGSYGLTIPRAPRI